MGLSCCGRTGGPHGRVSTKVGWPPRLYRGVQARGRPATAEGREDPGGGLTRAGYPAQRGAAVEATLRSWRHGGRRHERGRRPGQCPARSASANSRARAAAREEADGDRDPAGRAGGRKKKSVVAQRVRTVTQHPVATICRTLRMARQTAYYAVRIRPGGFYRRTHDETVLQQIRAVTNSRATYGSRRVWAMVNRTFRASYNRKRIRRLMRMHGLRAEPRPGSRTRAMPRQTPPSTAA